VNMIQVKFRSLKSSRIIREIILDKVGHLQDKFPDLKNSRIQVALAMQNSPRHPGPDVFSVSLNVRNGKYAGVRMEKSASNFYEALATLMDHMLEVLNRKGDRIRVKSRSMARRFMAMAMAQ